MKIISDPNNMRKMKGGHSASDTARVLAKRAIAVGVTGMLGLMLVDANAQTIGERVDSLESSVSTINGRLSGLQSDVSNLKNRLEGSLPSPALARTVSRLARIRMHPGQGVRQSV